MSKNSSKYLIGGLAVVTLGYFLVNSWNLAKRFADKLTVQLVGVGIPSVSNGTASLPVKLRLTNSEPLSIKVENFQLLIKLQKPEGHFVTAGQVNYPNALVIPAAGGITIDAVPVLTINTFTDLYSSGGLENLFKNLIDARPLATVKIQYSGTVEGFDFQGEELKEIKFNV